MTWLAFVHKSWHSHFCDVQMFYYFCSIYSTWVGVPFALNFDLNIRLTCIQYWDAILLWMKNLIMLELLLQVSSVLCYMHLLSSHISLWKNPNCMWLSLSVKSWYIHICRLRKNLIACWMAIWLLGCMNRCIVLLIFLYIFCLHCDNKDYFPSDPIEMQGWRSWLKGPKVIVFALQIQIACEHSNNITEIPFLLLCCMCVCIQIACEQIASWDAFSAVFESVHPYKAHLQSVLLLSLKGYQVQL
jgi:hypothetical protein